MSKTVLDLFAGIGGFSKGFQMSGYEIVLGIELEKVFAQAYIKNIRAKVKVMDIRKVKTEGIKVNVIIGGSPCQDFSIANLKANSYSSRAQLALEYLRIVSEIQPDYFVFENVTTVPKWLITAFKTFPGYKVTFNTIDTVYFSVAEHRDRLIIIGSKFEPIYLRKPVKAKIMTVRYAFTKMKVNYGFDKPTPEMRDKYKLVTRPLEWCRVDNGVPNYNAEKYKSIIRLAWNQPAVTIANIRKFNYIHPSKDQNISMGQALALHGWYDKVTVFGTQRQRAQAIANVVPPPLAYYISKLLYQSKKQIKKLW